MTAPTEGSSTVKSRWQRSVHNALQVADDPNTATLRMLVAPVVDDVDRVLDLDLSDAERAALVDIIGRRLRSVLGHTDEEGTAAYLATPAPEPIDIPSRGTWLRERFHFGLPNPRSRRVDTGPEWSGKWHAASGQIVERDLRSQEVDAVSICGRRVTLRARGLHDGSITRDAVRVDDQLGVDACGHCARRLA